MSLFPELALATWPKIEIHRHLEGSIRFETALELATEVGLLGVLGERAFEQQIRWHAEDTPSFATFLGKFRPLRNLYATRAAIERVAREAVAEAADENIRYLELRFNPDHYAEVAGHDIADVAEWIMGSAASEATRHKIMVRFILTINRTYDRSRAQQTVQAALRHRHYGVVGLDLAGDETIQLAHDLAPLFRHGASEGLGITIHAGEAGPPEHIWLAIQAFGAQRIGHGIRCVSDPALMHLMASRGIALEVCPTSNLQTGVVSSLAAHPLRQLLDAGVPVTLNTDDPCVSQITLTSEYHLALTTLGLAPSELCELVLNGARYAFLPPHEQQALERQLQRELESVVLSPLQGI